MKIKLNILKYNIGIIFVCVFLISTFLVLAGTLNVSSNINSQDILQKGFSILPDNVIMAFNSTTCPTGWVKADGSTNGSPDLRGVFIRGYGTPVGYSDATPSLDIGLRQDDSIQNIYNGSSNYFGGNTDDGASPKTGAFYDTGIGMNGANGGAGTGGVIGFDSSRVVRTSLETRPKNVALLYCMKKSTPSLTLPSYIPTPSSSGTCTVSPMVKDINGDGLITVCLNSSGSSVGVLVDDENFWNNVIPQSGSCSFPSSIIFIPINGVSNSNMSASYACSVSGLGYGFKYCSNGVISSTGTGGGVYGCK